MAKIKFGMMMTDARGKLGGQVFSKNRAGAYVRTKVTPANPQSVAQMNSRSILASLSIGWNALTESAIAAWNAAVNDWQKTDVFGDLKKPTGKNLYISLNKNLLQSGQASVGMPPAKVEVPQVAATAVVIDESDTSISFTGLTTVPSDVVLQVSATPVLQNGQNYVKNKLRVITYIATGSVTPANVWAAYAAKYGALAAGDRVAFELKYIANNGQAGIAKKFFATVQS
jgi:hypothetical protein